ncbi:Uu.00g099000.m01.CDS01 [Anthostomella pinea]|uniref:Uu.00g099000.m01.CDS01 n=1 Tax=Anthostomella pinea TaxID=933095 RepID=A0AAI8VCT0_9PEZI|nr:Uu.00g099000.m01.CDS01 [Anthostomella pinea]
MSTSYSFLPSWSVGVQSNLPRTNEALGAADHCDVISLLAVAQHHGVDLLSVTYQPARGDLGEGGEAVIRQSFVVKEVDLAFKTLKVFYGEVPDESSAQTVSRAFETMMTEITILSQPQVRESANVANLAGISWNVATKSVWPVFAYKRGVPLREHLVGNAHETSLSVERKLDLCVVHGDIKPQNIIMISGPQGHSIPRISDFSLSVIGQDWELRRLPRTPGWSAPEYHGRDFKICNARLMDVYSLGLVCHYILAWDQAFSHLSTTEEEDEAMQHLQTLARSNPAAPLQMAIGHLNKINLGEDTRSMVEQLFRSTLAPDPQDRAQSGTQVLSLLGPVDLGDPADKGQLASPIDIPNRCCFHVGRSIVQLSAADFRVREFIYQALKRSAASLRSECRRNNALQAAICSSVAFGTERSSEEVRRSLEIGQLDEKRLASELTSLKDVFRPDQPSSLPYLLQADLLHEYQRRGDMKAACRHLESEVEGLSSTFGEHHPVLAFQRASLAAVLDEAGKSRRAQELQTSVFETNRRMLGESHPETVASLAQLALLLDHAGQTAQAIETGKQALQLYRQSHLSDNRHSIAAEANLAMAYFHADRFEDAERLQAQVVTKYETILGPEHPSTLNCLNNQATFMMWLPSAKGEVALEINRRILKAHEKHQGPLHRDTLRAHSSLLGAMVQLHGPSMETLDAQRSVLQRAEAFLGPDSIDPWIYATNAASSMMDLGLTDDASLLYRKAWPNIDRLLGQSSRQTLDVMNHYARACRSQGLHEEARRICHEIIHEDQIISEDNETDEGCSEMSFRSLCTIALSYYDQRDYPKAKGLFERITKLSAMNWGSPFAHSESRLIMSYLQDLYQSDGDAQGAVDLNKLLVQWETQDDDPRSLASQINLAGAYAKNGNYKVALETLPDLYERALQKHGPQHEITVASVTHLTRSWSGLEMHEPAISLGRDVLANLKETVGPAHEDTLLIMNNLATSLLTVESFTEAEALLTGLREVHTEQNNHEGSCLAMHNLAYLYHTQGKFKDAIKIQRDLVQKHMSQSTISTFDSVEERYYLASYLRDDPACFQESLQLSKDTWVTADSSYGYDHHLTMLAANLAGEIQMELGNLDEAQMFFDRVLKAAENITTDNKDQWLKDTRRNLELLQAKRRGDCAKNTAWLNSFL